MSSNRRGHWVLTALTLLAWCSTPRTEAQPPSPPGAPPIRLSAGALVPAAGVDRALAAAAPGSLPAGRLYFIIQFESRPSERDRTALAALGIRLLDPIPVNAYFAVADPRAQPPAEPSTFDVGGPLAQPPYRAVVLLPREYKLSPLLAAALRGQPVPQHADRGNGRVALSVRFHAEVPAQERVTVLRDLGLTADQPGPIDELQTGIEVTVPIADVLQVAENGLIRSIDFIERDGEDDNNNVRSAAGADSDAVVTAYGVDGANVVIAQFERNVAGAHTDLSSSVDIADATAGTSDHATHVAGTLIGSGTVNSQWRGIATGAKIRAYDKDYRQPEYVDAIANNVIASNTSWGSASCHQLSTAVECYDEYSEFYDKVISGRTETGAATALPRRILFVGSAGNLVDAPERHADNVIANGRYDPGEAIYEDINNNGRYETSDRSKVIVGATNPAPNSPLIDFAMNERHDEVISAKGYGSGAYEETVLPAPDEVIYRDADNSEDVSVGDVRLSPSPFGAAGSHVQAGDADVNVQVGDVRLVSTPAGPAGSTVQPGATDISTPDRYLRQFLMWGNVRLENSAKNTLVVGDYIAGLDGNVFDLQSGRGPTPDGRLKPDLVAAGNQSYDDFGVTSTTLNNTYTPFDGTSSATPVVTAVAAMLIEWYRSACATADPKPSTLRATLLHSAVDMTQIPPFPGVFTGPDYAYGYGAVNAPNAMAVMAHHREGVATAADVGDAGAHTFEMTIGGVTDLKVTLAWDDPPWTAGTPRDPVTGLLHNDLDLELEAPDGRIYTPWRLDPFNPGAPAVASPGYAAGVAVPSDARDHRNTVEQIVVPDAPAGPWKIRVLASTLGFPDQDFSVVSDFLEPQEGVPCSATPPTDVWMRDDPANGGSSPSVAPWLSLDVWNDNGRALNPAAASRHDDPAFDEVNQLYVRLRNRSTQAARASSIDVWAAPASTAPSWPTDFAYVGRLGAPTLGASQARVFGPLEWVPTRRSPSDQLTYYVRVTNPRDPIPSGAQTAAQDNNVVLRNVHELDIGGGTEVVFELGGFTSSVSGLAEVDLVFSFGSRSSRPPQIDATLLLDSQVQQRWLAAGARGSGFARPANASQPIELTSSFGQLRVRVDPLRPDERLVRLSFAPTSQEGNPVQLDVVQCNDDLLAGGIRYVLYTGPTQRPRDAGVRPPRWFNGRNCSP